MISICATERRALNRVTKFFRSQLKYTYLGDLHDRANRNIMRKTWVASFLL